jgi:hypothetical protein
VKATSRNGGDFDADAGADEGDGAGGEDVASGAERKNVGEEWKAEE